MLAPLVLSLLISAAPPSTSVRRDGLELTFQVDQATIALPQELVLKVTVRNLRDQTRTIPLSICELANWMRYVSLQLTIDGKRRFTMELNNGPDTADLHPHGPLVLKPHEAVEYASPLGESVFFSEDEGIVRALLTAHSLELRASMFLDDVHPTPALVTSALRVTVKAPPLPEPLGGPCLTQLTANTGRFCALRNDGTPYCWDETADVVTPRRIELVRGATSELAEVSGRLWARTTSGLLAFSSSDSAESFASVDAVGRIANAEGTTKLWNGTSGGCESDSDGGLRCALLNQVYDGFASVHRVPLEPTTWIDVKTRGTETCGVNDTGHAWCWTAALEPKPLSPESPVAALATGSDFTCLRTRSGAVSCWNDAGPLATPPSWNSGVVELVAGGTQRCVRKEGLPSFECLGLWDQKSDDPPRSIAGVPVDATSLRLDRLGGCAWNAKGAWCWRDSATATSIPGFSGVQTLVSDDRVSWCAITGKGTQVKCSTDQRSPVVRPIPCR